MKIAKDKQDFHDELQKLFDWVKEESIEFIEEFDFDKARKFIKNRINKCRERRRVKKESID